MSDINIKKIEKFAYLIYAAVFFCFTVGAYDRIAERQLFGLNFMVSYLLLAAVLFGLLFLYFRRIKRCIAKGSKSAGLSFMRLLHRYRFLIEQLVVRDFKIKYKRSVLGVFWSFLNPMLMMIVQYIVFSRLLNLRGGVEHYAIYLLCGIVMWNGFNDCSTQAMRSITGNTALITKVYVPKFIYPVTKVLSASINVLLSMIPLLLVTLVYGLFSDPHLFLSKSIVLLPFGLLFLLIFCLGMGFLLSALMVFFRDVEFLWSVIATIWMYATPIIYSLSMFEDKEEAAWLISLMRLNPLYHFIQFIRTIILDRTSPEFSAYGVCLLFGLGMLLIGYWFFKKSEDKFILYL